MSVLFPKIGHGKSWEWQEYTLNEIKYNLIPRHIVWIFIYPYSQTASQAMKKIVIFFF